MNQMKCRTLGLTLYSLCFLVSPLALRAEVALNEYVAQSLPAGTLTSVGSDSMGGLMQRWIDGYSKIQPAVKVRATSKGSASAPPALIEGSADLAPMARPMKVAERNTFLNTFGFAPTQVQVAYAVIGVYVSVDSPLTQISIEQLRTLYSAESAAVSWKGLGVEVTSDLDAMPLTVLGQVSHPYLAGYFRQQVLLQQPYSSRVMEAANSQSLFDLLSRNPAAIGFAAIDYGYPKERVKLLPVVNTAGEAITPSQESITSGAYPLSRSLNIYVALEPNEELELPLKDFLSFVLSKQGQEIVAQQGLVPLSGSQAAEQKKLFQ